MKEFLTFNSVGGGSLDVSTAGDYVIPIENIIAVDSGGFTNSTHVAIWNSTTGATASECCFYRFQISGSKTAVIEAFYKAIEAKPGGRGSKVLLPAGTSITSWSYINEGIY
tara:strand:- start:1452 stop:1784 length:333 start_codon:yes stop_codon:yes gene_type:complete